MEDDYWTDGLDETVLRKLPVQTEAEKEAERQRKAKSDRDSKKLGELLLQGWCMLDTYCPNNCLMPLMRDKQKREYCVSCGRFISEMEEEEAERKRQDEKHKTEQEKQKASEKGAGKAATASDDADLKSHGKRARHTDDEEEEDSDELQATATLGSSTGSSPVTTIAFPTPAEAAQQLASRADQHPVSSTSSHLGASAFPTTPSFVPPPGPSFALPTIAVHPAAVPSLGDVSSYVGHAQQVLTRKLAEASQLLAATPVANARRCSDLVALIADCAKALHELERF